MIKIKPFVNGLVFIILLMFIVHLGFAMDVSVSDNKIYCTTDIAPWAIVGWRWFQYDSILGSWRVIDERPDEYSQTSVYEPSESGKYKCAVYASSDHWDDYVSDDEAVVDYDSGSGNGSEQQINGKVTVYTTLQGNTIYCEANVSPYAVYGWKWFYYNTSFGAWQMLTQSTDMTNNSSYSAEVSGKYRCVVYLTQDDYDDSSIDPTNGGYGEVEINYPIISSISIQGMTKVGKTIYVIANTLYADTVEYAFYKGNEEIKGFSTDNSLTITTELAHVIITAKVRACNSVGCVESSTDFEIENTQPIIDIFDLDKNQVKVNDQITIDVKVSDADNDEVTITINATANGRSITNTFNKNTVDFSIIIPQEWAHSNVNVKVSVDDNHNGIVTSSRQFTVINSLPQISAGGVNYEEYNTTHYKIIATQPSVADVDGDSVVVEYKFVKNASGVERVLRDYSSSNELILSKSSVAGSEVIVYYRVDDGHGGLVEDVYGGSVSIGNQPPVLNVNLLANDVHVNDVVVLNVSAEDVDSANVALHVDFLDDSGSVLASYDGFDELDISENVPASWSHEHVIVNVTAEDDSGNIVGWQGSFNVLNSFPMLNSSSLNVYEYNRTHYKLVANAVVTDIDGDSVDIAYKFVKNSSGTLSVLRGYSNDSVLYVKKSLVSDSEVIVYYRVDDGHGGLVEDVYGSSYYFAYNHPILNLNAEGASNTLEDFSCIYNVVDCNNCEITLQILKNKVVVINDSNLAQTSGVIKLDHTQFVKNDQLTCMLIVDDGVSEYKLNESKIVGNYNPEIRSFTYAGELKTYHFVDFEVDAYDADVDDDKDRLVYEWYIDGVVLATTTDNKWHHMFFSQGVHNVTVVVRDESNTTASQTLSLRVMPEHMNVEVSYLPRVIVNNTQIITFHVEANNVSVENATIFIDGDHRLNCHTGNLGNCRFVINETRVGTVKLRYVVTKNGLFTKNGTIDYEVLPSGLIIRDFGVYNDDHYSNATKEFYRGSTIYVKFKVINLTSNVTVPDAESNVNLISQNHIYNFTGGYNSKYGEYRYYFHIPLDDEFLGMNFVVVIAIKLNSGGQYLYTVIIKNNPVMKLKEFENLSLIVGQSRTYRLYDYFNDIEDRDNLSFFVTGCNDVLNISLTSDEILRLSAISPGVCELTVMAKDSDGSSVSDSFQVVVNSVPVHRAKLAIVSPKPNEVIESSNVSVVIEWNETHDTYGTIRIDALGYNVEKDVLILPGLNYYVLNLPNAVCNDNLISAKLTVITNATTITRNFYVKCTERDEQENRGTQPKKTDIRVTRARVKSYSNSICLSLDVNFDYKSNSPIYLTVSSREAGFVIRRVFESNLDSNICFDLPKYINGKIGLVRISIKHGKVRKVFYREIE